jgi:hypothetical protein
LNTGGADRIRTCDPHNAIVVLYQLSYDPIQSAAQSKVSAALVKMFFNSAPQIKNAKSYFEL